MAGWNALIGEQVVGFERLSRGGDPFSAGRDASLAALVDRQLERVDQDFDLVARRDVRDGRPLAKRVFVDIVERGEPAREKLAIDHPLGKSVGGAEAELPGELIEPLSSQPLVSRSQRLEPIAD